MLLTPSMGVNRRLTVHPRARAGRALVARRRYHEKRVGWARPSMVRQTGADFASGGPRWAEELIDRLVDRVHRLYADSSFPDTAETRRHCGDGSRDGPPRERPVLSPKTSRGLSLVSRPPEGVRN